jgi:hypothetical protein
MFAKIKKYAQQTGRTIWFKVTIPFKPTPKPTYRMCKDGQARRINEWKPVVYNLCECGDYMPNYPTKKDKCVACEVVTMKEKPQEPKCTQCNDTGLIDNTNCCWSCQVRR